MPSIIDKKDLTWKSEFNLGDFKVDNEHQSLFVLAKKALNVRDILDDDKAEIELKEIVNSLYKYVAIHFKNEEQFMKRVNYPGLTRHKKIHVEMLNTLHSFVKTLNNLSLNQIEIQLYNFIKDYFITHITQEDIHIGIWDKPLEKLKGKHTKYQKAYSMGNEHLDEQHKELFNIVNEAFIKTDDEHREQKIKDVFKRLYKYMRKHFIDEENFMQNIQYPLLNKHRKIHQNILNDCNNLLSKVNGMDEKLFEKELAVFIDRHIVEHVINEDHKIALWHKHHKE